jgi:hypothetical protein
MYIDNNYLYRGRDFIRDKEKETFIEKCKYIDAIRVNMCYAIKYGMLEQ